MQPVDRPEPPRTVTPEGPQTPVQHWWRRWRRWRQDGCPDLRDFVAGAALSPEQALAVLRFDQCARWRGGERVPAERYLEADSLLQAHPEHGLLLVYGGFLLRQELGEVPALDEYLHRFPHYAQRLRQQDDFHRALAGLSGPDPVTPPPAPALPEQAGHCRIVGEIARGGMGVILQGHDEHLGRDLAVKVLRDECKDQPDVVRRFLEEAQVSGQLQHPGVVPVHEVGRCADGRPYFTMKLVRGRTLAALLAERADPA
jgi:hypothetical protein